MTGEQIINTGDTRGNKGKGLLLTGIIIIGVTLALINPILAVITIWPIFLFVPGWWLFARLLPKISAPGRAGLAIIFSVFVSSQLVYLTSLLFHGYGMIPIAVSAGLLWGFTVIIGSIRVSWLGPRPEVSLEKAKAALNEFPWAWMLAFLAFAVVLVVMTGSDWRQVSGGFVSGGWNWSDFLVHVSIASSIQHGNFPPLVPYFAGAPLLYHWFGDFQVGIISTASGVGVIPLMGLMNAVMAGALALLVWELAYLWLNNRRAAGVATVLAIFGGGMGYIRLPIDFFTTHSSIWQLITTQSYDNNWNGNWPFFHVASVLGTGLTAQRATAYGLAGLVAIVILVDRSLGKSKVGMLTAGILAAFLAPFQLFFFPMVYLVVLMVVIGKRFWTLPGWWWYALIFILPVVYELPFISSVISKQQGQGAIQWVLGWPDSPLSGGPLGEAFFYATNLGIPFILAVIAAFWKGLPRRFMLVGWLAVLFIVPNVLVASSASFDMNKIFQAMWIAVAIMAAWFIRKWPGWALAGIIFLSVLSPFLVSIWYLTDNSLALTTAQVSAAQWIDSNIPNNAVFVTDAFINSPVDLAGRLRIDGYGPDVSNLGFNPTARQAATNVVYCNGPQAAAKVMRTYGADYVLSSGGLLTCNGHTATNFSSSPLFQTLYSVDGVSVWQLVN